MNQIKHIVLGVTGGIAAYKAAAFARRLQDAGFTVQVVMTEGAQAFITPLTFQALTGEPVHTELLDPAAEAGMGHIELAKWADLVVIAPASANCIARLAAGMADDLLTTICLATAAPIAIAPAMNQQMWASPATQTNMATLADFGYDIIAPASGNQACGDVGAGRLPEPEELVKHVSYIAAKKTQPQVLAGKHVVITAGPTQEAIDPVRYISNYSTGKMGFALARACRNAGANVTLVAGKVALATPVLVNRVDVRSARDMLAACETLTNNADKPCDIFIATAAVADYRTREAAPQKIKKSQDEMLLDLVKNPDIVATIAANHPETFVVGFAAETQNMAAYAKGKLEKKKLSMIASNDVSRNDIGFGADQNAMTVFFANENLPAVELAKASKDEIAKQLVGCLATALQPDASD